MYAVESGVPMTTPVVVRPAAPLISETRAIRNEAKQSLRVWRLGYRVWVLAGAVAAPLALERARPDARPVLVAWLSAWVLLMVLKDPVFFPRLLRWAKEDQFLSPLLCVLIGAAVWSLPRPWIRAAAGAP